MTATCPECNRQLDEVECMPVEFEFEPQIKDIYVCVMCGALLKYEGDKHRCMAEEEVKQLPQSAQDEIEAMYLIARFLNPSKFKCMGEE